ncbi:Transposase DDE domain protein [uncultured archaeon]|nr:Transposase DDE domain protein [uncultured archaeon]
MDCKYCGSDDIKKYGMKHYRTRTAQRYRCYSCGRQWQVVTSAALTEFESSIPGINSGPQTIDWPSYNEAQIQEKLRFLEILSDLCSYISDEEPNQVGRPRASLKEMTFCMVAKLYEGLSSRRVSSDLELARKNGYIDTVPHFNTLLKYFNDIRMGPILETLIRLSALPLKDFETTFAIDASGLSSAFYSRWFDVRLDPGKKGKDWIKIHIVCGTKSNIITAITVTDGDGADSPQFPELLNKTAEHFRVKEIMADKAYSSRNNMDVAIQLGAVPYIPFKVNATGKSKGSMAWWRMFHYFQYHKDKFMARYHQRSNVESTFSMLKRKFSGKLMMKNEQAQVNEALAKLLCHNICVLIRESYESGVRADFEASAHLFPVLHTNKQPILTED